MAQIDRLFEKMLARKGSDLHLVEGQQPKIRKDGEITPLEDEAPLSRSILQSLLQEICEPRRWEKFLTSKDIDFAYDKDEKSRFRCNYYFQVHGLGAVFRIIPTKILTLAQLGMPPAVKTLAHFRSGLVLVTGPTGSGKSTTLAAIINHINETYNRYILTIEEPIEFVHSTKRSTFCQREVGIDLASFSEGLRIAGRQDCDVVLVGEMRDFETISLALSAAAKGVLVFGTLHTNSATKTIDRIIDVFPPALQGAARSILADSLRGICAQLLMKKIGGGRIAVNEILLEGPGMATSIREGNIANLQNIIVSGRSRGMRLMDESIIDAAKAGLVSVEDGYLLAKEKEAYRAATKEAQG